MFVLANFFIALETSWRRCLRHHLHSVKEIMCCHVRSANKVSKKTTNKKSYSNGTWSSLSLDTHKRYWLVYTKIFHFSFAALSYTRMVFAYHSDTQLICAWLRAHTARLHRMLPLANSAWHTYIDVYIYI